MHRPLVSITMSAFNVEGYLRASLDCVVNQTLREVEIICVNDGSTDKTLSILEEYAAKDPRIIILNKPVNEGLAVARNESLAAASGKYIGFVDGDDLLDRDLFRKACERAEETKSDLVIWDYVTFWNEHELAQKVKEPSALSCIQPTDKTALLKRPSFAWTKLIRLDKAREMNISFPRGLTRQDIPVHWKLITQIANIAVLRERLSWYRQQPEATTHRNGWKVFQDVVTVMDLVRDYLVENDLYPAYRDVFIWHQLELLAGMLDRVEGRLKAQALKMIEERLIEDHWRYLQDRKPLRGPTRDFYLALKGEYLSILRRAVWMRARKVYRKINDIL